LRSVDLSGNGVDLIMLGVMLGLLVGKPLGIVGACWLAVKAGLCSLPRGVNFRGLTVVGLVGAIGFTMAIFIAGLALPSAAYLSAAKLAVLLASLAAGVLAFLVGRMMLPASPESEIADLTVDQVEASTNY
jgi:NhaA family Na+:H+ antiporter